MVTGYGWWVDATSEWFPVLAARPSVATVQGYEWMGKGAWTAQVERDTEYQLCATSTTACLRTWAGTSLNGLYVYLPKGALLGEASPSDDGSAALRSSLRATPELRLLYDEPGASIFLLLRH